VSVTCLRVGSDATSRQQQPLFTWPELVDDSGAELLDAPAVSALVEYNPARLTAKHTATVGVVEHGQCLSVIETGTRQLQDA